VAFVLLFIVSIYLGPFLGALVVTRATEGGAGVRRLLKRTVQWRVGLRWYLAAIFSFLLIWLAAYSILLRGAPLEELIANPGLLVTLFIPWLLQGIFIPSLGEELGWRGFALPRMQRSYGPILATALLGALQGVWHLPILFTPLLGPFSLDVFASFVLTAVGAAFLYTWVFNNARASVLIAILMHASSNAASRLMVALIPPEAIFPAPFENLSPGWLNAILFGLAAILLVILTRGRLGYRQEGALAEQTTGLPDPNGFN
jgi:membrane protease YdiL (CAAX protease family)